MSRQNKTLSLGFSPLSDPIFNHGLQVQLGQRERAVFAGLGAWVGDRAGSHASLLHVLNGPIRPMTDISREYFEKYYK